MDNRTNEIKTTDNNTYKKVAVQWLNEALCPAVYMWDLVVVSRWLSGSFVLKNPQLLILAKH